MKCEKKHAVRPRPSSHSHLRNLSDVRKSNRLDEKSFLERESGNPLNYEIEVVREKNINACSENTRVAYKKGNYCKM